LPKKFTHDEVPLIGTWKLISFELQRASGEVLRPYGDDAQGIVIYSETGHFSAQVTRADRANNSAAAPEQNGADCKGFISYFGPYEYHGDEGFVLHHVAGSLFPAWEGQTQQRFVELAGDRLTLRTPPTVWSGGEKVIGILSWERIE